MRDLNLTRVISLVAVGSLLIATTGCDNYRRAARSLCKQVKECTPRVFELTYDGDMQECIEYYEEELDYLEVNFGRNCAETYSDYLRCRGKEGKELCSEEIVNRKCEQDFYDAYYACGDVVDADYGRP